MHPKELDPGLMSRWDPGKPLRFAPSVCEPSAEGRVGGDVAHQGPQRPRGPP